MTVTTIRESVDGLHWASQGACTKQDPEDFFVQGAQQQKAKLLCRGCPVLELCLADALNNRIEFGVWGGMTERERRRLLRTHPSVDDWLEVLQSTPRKTA